MALLTNVILRYGFDSGITWVYEIHAILLPWLVAGGILIAAARGGTSRSPFCPTRLRRSQAKSAFMPVDLILLVIAISVLWSSQPILGASNPRPCRRSTSRGSGAIPASSRLRRDRPDRGLDIVRLASRSAAIQIPA